MDTAPTSDGTPPEPARTTIPLPPRETPNMAECDQFSELVSELDRKRAAAADVHAAMLGERAHRLNLEAISRTMQPLTEEQILVREGELAVRELEREQYARADRWRAFIRDRGERYATCRLATFDQTHDGQKAAVKLLTDYCHEISDRIADGEGVILFGPKGTGKDHLAVALCRAAIANGKHVVWQNGMDLFGDIRDAMDKGTAERSVVSRLVAPDVLYLSDPLPPLGTLTEFQAGMLFRVLDGRYSRRRPIWVTVNVSGAKELDERLGAQNGDRLRDGALALFCDWPSYRKVRS